ncbi:uncharacterized protein [Triticum aestivum]|uniref:uncharacterized protein n=1 Tax=Triticum aestivum TaxID=4565 RepID=UPI001D004509|nr:uncharacterized protein LOC123168114 [Triticum aestivum]
MDRQGNGDPGDDESATASWEMGGGSEAGAEVTGVTRGSEREAEGVRGGVLAGVTAGSVAKPSKAQAEASSKAGGGSVVGAEVEGSSASFVAEGMGVPLVLTVAEIAAQGFDIGVDILLTTVEEEDVDPDAEAEFDAMILANNLRFAQQLRQDENVHTNQPNPENDILYLDLALHCIREFIMIHYMDLPYPRYPLLIPSSLNMKMRMRMFTPINPTLRMILYLDLALHCIREFIMIHYMDLPYLRSCCPRKF